MMVKDNRRGVDCFPLSIQVIIKMDTLVIIKPLCLCALQRELRSLGGIRNAFHLLFFTGLMLWNIMEASPFLSITLKLVSAEAKGRHAVLHHDI